MWWACAHVNVCTCVYMCAYALYSVHVCLDLYVYAWGGGEGMSWLICAYGHHSNEVITNTLKMG